MSPDAKGCQLVPSQRATPFAGTSPVASDPTLRNAPQATSCGASGPGPSGSHTVVSNTVPSVDQPSRLQADPLQDEMKSSSRVPAYWKSPPAINCGLSGPEASESHALKHLTGASRIVL